MVDKDIIFSKEPCGNTLSGRSFSITVEGDAGDYLTTIRALLTLVGSQFVDGVDYQNERYYICELIQHMLPSYEQMKMIEDTQINNE